MSVVNMLPLDFAQVIRAYLSGGSLVPDRYNEINMTYSSPGVMDTATYILNGVELCTLTFSYAGDDITNVVRVDA